MADCYVYILSNVSRTLYVGVTSDLDRCLSEHKRKLSHGFTRKHNLTMLVYYEVAPDIVGAIAREKQIKGWVRAKKVSLIEATNSNWLDLTGHCLSA